MAGLSAAARVAAEGDSVVLVEKADRVGGSARFAGFVWTAPTIEELRRVNPDGDPELAEALPSTRRTRRRPPWTRGCRR